MNLTDLPLKQFAEVGTIDTTEEKVQRLAELGIREGSIITILMKTPFKGPVIVQVGQSIITVRSEDAVCIKLKGK